MSWVLKSLTLLSSSLLKNHTKLHTPVRKIMSWSCTKCTNLNPPLQKSCQICLSPSLTPSPQPLFSSSSPSPSSKPKWSCKACTFMNTVGTSNCEVCGTRSSASLISDFEELDSICNNEELDSSIGNVFYPLQRCSNKRKSLVSSVSSSTSTSVSSDGSGELGKFRSAKMAKIMEKEESFLDDVTPTAGPSTLKIMSYNVWFREDLEMYNRMKSLSSLIQQHSPDVICFQEVTPNIYETFQQFSWWEAYHCSVSTDMLKDRSYFCMQLSKEPVKSFSSKPFRSSIMERELCVAEIEVKAGKPLVVATSHLESPCPGPPTWDQMFSKERVDQAKEAFTFLNNSTNVVFCGDMNWDDKLDGNVPFPDGWVDAWAKLRPREDGFTYDTKSNQMLSANRKLQKRLDRFLCSFRDYKISGIDMIGTEAIPGLSYCKEKKVKNELKKLMLPVYPSDHYGLLLTICRT
ncbi:hypothetical protein IFM89_032298 [Coptis chinensis]|uniref:RanBP2-type domain-containing protein n=1 Tax=Coptis chinensis TaxID=261450 RepID=A0A835LD93_9MAGN|nr:hypothetical protein IFM89_032298 [Coptis chinensis]